MCTPSPPPPVSVPKSTGQSQVGGRWLCHGLAQGSGLWFCPSQDAGPSHPVNEGDRAGEGMVPAPAAALLWLVTAGLLLWREARCGHLFLLGRPPQTFQREGRERGPSWPCHLLATVFGKSLLYSEPLSPLLRKGHTLPISRTMMNS